MRKDINMKYKRQGQIVRIIKEKPIKTHEQLIEELSKSGYNVTQATVSRDIKDLGLIKIPVQGEGAIYAVSDGAGGGTDKNINMFSDTVLDIDSALHTVVIKTYPGMAQAVAASVDSIMKNEFLGSIAGDDTVLIIASSPETAAEIAGKLRKIFKSK